MIKNKILKQLRKAKGFGSLEVIQRLPKKSRRPCNDIAQQLKAIRGTMDLRSIEMREEIALLLLTDEQELIASVSLYRGTSNECNFDIREIIQLAAIAGAYFIIMAHNHPDGHVQPSNTDVDTASKISHSLRFAGMELLDFVIVGRKKYYSFVENDLLRV